MNHEQRGAALLQVVMEFGTYNWVTFVRNGLSMMCKTHFEKRLGSFIVMPHACIDLVHRSSAELIEYPVDAETLAEITMAARKNVALEVSECVAPHSELMEFSEAVCSIIIKG